MPNDNDTLLNKENTDSASTAKNSSSGRTNSPEPEPNRNRRVTRQSMKLTTANSPMSTNTAKAKSSTSTTTAKGSASTNTAKGSTSTNTAKGSTSTNNFTLDAAQTSLQKIGLSLRPHQLEGVQMILNWYKRGHGGILADEMGLGKTCQAIIATAILSEEIGPKMRVLVICPLSVIDHWEYEVKRFSCGRLKIFRYYATKEVRREMRQKSMKDKEWNVLLTTFETFLNDSKGDLLGKYTWDIAVFDEAHRVKCDTTLLHQALAHSRIHFLLLMTGTPIQNDLFELYSLLKLVDTHRFKPAGMQEFVDKYSELGKNEEVSKEFRELFDEYCLRRNKKILTEVPKCSEVILYHGITKFQYDMYRAILADNREFFYKVMNSEKNARQSLMATMQQLRKCCNHPYLFPGIEPEPFEEGEHLVNSSGKTLILDRLLDYLYKRGHRVLIFSQFVRYLNIVHDILELRGYICEELVGNVKSSERLRMVENFQRPGSDVFAMLLSTRAGGLGLNLTAADTAIFLDWDFNPQMDKQAAARCHRIGQDKPVKIIRLIAKHTLEELIKYRATKKLKLSELVLGTDENEGPKSQVDFSNLLLEGLKELEEEQKTDAQYHLLTDEQLEEKIGRTTRKRLWEVPEENNETEVNLLYEDEDPGAAFKSMYMFEGRDYTEDRLALQRYLEERNIESALANKKGDRATAGSIATPGSFNVLLGHRKTRRPLTSEELLERRQKKAEQERIRREKAEAERAERKRRLWEANNYQSTNLPLPPKEEEPTKSVADTRRPRSLVIYNVQGDVTKPVRASDDRSTHALVLQTVDDGGHFGVGGLFSALRALSERVPERYELAVKMKDLHRADAHLIEAVSDQKDCKPSEGLAEDEGEGTEQNDDGLDRTVSVVLMVVQSVRDRYTKQIFVPALEKCLRRVQHYALEHAATSVHLPQIWFGVQNLDEAKARSLLARHLCSKGINVYIYSFRRTGTRRAPHNLKQPFTPNRRAKTPSPPHRRGFKKRSMSPQIQPTRAKRPKAEVDYKEEEEEEEEKNKEEKEEGEEEVKKEEEEEYVSSESEEEEMEEEEDELLEEMDEEEGEEEEDEEEQEEDEGEEGERRRHRIVKKRYPTNEDSGTDTEKKKIHPEGGKKSSPGWEEKRETKKTRTEEEEETDEKEKTLVEDRKEEEETEALVERRAETDIREETSMEVEGRKDEEEETDEMKKTLMEDRKEEEEEMDEGKKHPEKGKSSPSSAEENGRRVVDERKKKRNVLFSA